MVPQVMVILFGVLALPPVTEGAPPPAETEDFDYCVVGAGPGGLQMGSLLQQKGRRYIVLERGPAAGHFYATYPRHRTLISINKIHSAAPAGADAREFELRHDWNSLLSDDPRVPLFRNFSAAYFPPAGALLRYLAAFAEARRVAVRFNTTVGTAERLPAAAAPLRFLLRSSTTTQNDGAASAALRCVHLIWATGVATPNMPTVLSGAALVEHYGPDLPADSANYTNQTVMIVGSGNAAYELANALTPTTAAIHMFARAPVRHAWQSHYVGHVRAVNNNFLDTYQLKSLNALGEWSAAAGAPFANFSGVVARADKSDPSKRRLYLIYRPPDPETGKPTYKAVPMPHAYHRIIFCWGFSMDAAPLAPLGRALRLSHGGKYAALDAEYGAAGVPGLHFAGTLTHQRDFRKSSGGFIHGFRYTAQALHRMLERKHHGVAWPSEELAATSLQAPEEKVAATAAGLLTTALLKRINEASSLYQMFGEFGDVIAARLDSEVRSGPETTAEPPLSLRYYQSVPVRFAHEQLLPELCATGGYGHFFVLTFEYGRCFSHRWLSVESDTFRSQRAESQLSRAHKSNFIHPVVRWYEARPACGNSSGSSGAAAVARGTHHVLESFSTEWLDAEMHVRPLREFLDWATGSGPVPKQTGEGGVADDRGSCSTKVVADQLQAFAFGDRSKEAVAAARKGLPLGHAEPSNDDGGAPLEELLKLKEKLEALIRIRTDKHKDAACHADPACTANEELRADDDRHDDEEDL